MRPEISIIVPVHDVERYLEDCLNSILSQTFKEFEVILINDGSTDRSGFICDAYSLEDRRIRVLHKDHEGVSAARNDGVSLAKGNYIGFVDSDDRIDKDMYGKLLGLCKQTKSDIAICQLGREIDGSMINENQKEFIKGLSHIEAMRELFKGNLYRFSLCNKLFKRSCFNNVTFPEGRIHEDLATTYKLFANANQAIYTNYIGYVYVKREKSILTSRYNQRRLDAFLGWEEILPFMQENYPQLSTEYMSCFSYGCVDNIHYVLNQVEDSEKKEAYLAHIQGLVRKYYKEIINSKVLSLRHKYTLILLKNSISFLLLLNHSRGLFRKELKI